MNLFSSRLQTKAIQISSTQNIQIAIGCVLADITDAYEILLLHVLSELRMNNFSNFLSFNLRFRVSSCVKMVIGKAIECPIKCWVSLRKSSNLNIVLWCHDCKNTLPCYFGGVKCSMILQFSVEMQSKSLSQVFHKKVKKNKKELHKITFGCIDFCFAKSLLDIIKFTSETEKKEISKIATMLFHENNNNPI